MHIIMQARFAPGIVPTAEKPNQVSLVVCLFYWVVAVAQQELGGTSRRTNKEFAMA